MVCPPLQAVQNFVQSQRGTVFADLPVLNYMTSCHGSQTLQMQLSIIHSTEPPHLMMDSTGVKQ
ncbi:transposase [Burkholderia ubonensis]|uniref:transposase n=1 Tax=Burkholderia ubonensis TaxID=101571 RepID=UPI0009B43EF2